MYYHLRHRNFGSDGVRVVRRGTGGRRRQAVGAAVSCGSLAMTALNVVSPRVTDIVGPETDTTTIPPPEIENISSAAIALKNRARTSAVNDATETVENARDVSSSRSTEKTSKKTTAAAALLHPEHLESLIRVYGKEEFMRRFGGRIFNDPVIAKLINGIRENKRDIKTILSNLVAEDEGVIASEVEMSDQDFDERRFRQENSVQPGKTGVLVILFKRLLEWIFGKEFLEEALEAAKKERMIRDRMKDQNIFSRDMSPEKLNEILDMSISKNAPFRGAIFDPSSKQWPNMQTLDLAPALLRQKLQSIIERPSSDGVPESGALGLKAA